MSNVSIAATVFGVSFFELLAFNVPTVVFSPYEGENNCELSEISSMGIALVAQNFFEATELLNVLLEDDNLRKKLEFQSKEIMLDYTGKRFTKEVNKLFTI